MPIHPEIKIKPLKKPVMLYDGECLFCCRWIERWRRWTGSGVEYIAYQTRSDSFKNIPINLLEKAVFYVDKNAEVTSGALAVIKSLNSIWLGKFFYRLYSKLIGARAVLEGMYRFIANHRSLLSIIEKWTIGDQLLDGSQKRVEELFVRVIGFIFSLAFLSVAIQINGLVGSEGILPIGETLDYLRAAWGGQKFFLYPTLSWINSSDTWLVIQAVLGVLASILLGLGCVRRILLLLMWMLYLSLSIAGQTFFSFQWDTLLIEVGFLCLFMDAIPWIGKRQKRQSSWVAGFLFKWLLFRLMFASGYVKIISADPVWRDFSALDFHYFTQPLPTFLAWYCHHFFSWINHLSVFVMYVIELVLPFFVFGPRRFRQIAFIGFSFLMLLISLTGNYCFFNILTIAIGLWLIDDDSLKKLLFNKKKSDKNILKGNEVKKANKTLFSKVVCSTIVMAIFIMSSINFAQQIGNIDYPPYIRKLQSAVAPFRSFNTYGLFANMTTKRREIELQGSIDGKNWIAYEFKYKPGGEFNRPRFNIPHQPRLDWQMWFAALAPFNKNPWLQHLSKALLNNSTSVKKLFDKTPFGLKAPKYIRMVLYDYQFSDPVDRRQTGRWWKRRALGKYSPVISL